MSKPKTARKLLSVLLVLCMTLTLCLTASAEGTTVRTEPLDCTEFTKNTANEAEGWVWYKKASSNYNNKSPITDKNHPANTLVLNNATIVTEEGIAIELPEAATLYITPNTVNTVKAKNTDGEGISYGVVGYGDLTVRGDGHLIAECGSSTNDFVSGFIVFAKLSIVGNCTLDAINGDMQADGYDSFTLYTSKAFTITGAPVITAVSGAGMSGCYSIFTEDTLTVKGGATLNAVAGKPGPNRGSSCIFARDTITLTGTKTDRVKVNVDFTYENGGDYGVYGGRGITVSYADIIVGKADQYLLSNALRTKEDVKMDNCSLTAFVNGTALSVVNATITASEMNIASTTDASIIWASKKLTIDSSNITTRGGYDGIGTGGNITIKNGSTIDCQPLPGHEDIAFYGIAIEPDTAGGAISIDKSTIIAKGAANESYGIYNVKGAITITKSIVTAAGNQGAMNVVPKVKGASFEAADNIDGTNPAAGTIENCTDMKWVRVNSGS